MLLLGGCLNADFPKISMHNGCSDPSTATAVNNRYFVAGDDEHNILRVYSVDGLPDPVFSLDVTGFLKADAEHPEADIEASARIGQRIYWITSHGRNKDGKIRSSRYRFFATDIQITDPNQPPQIVPVGKACSTLVTDMLANPQLSKLKLQEVTRLEEPLTKKQQAQLAPKEKGLNIEGLAVGPDGKSLWIALRNPLYSDASGKPRAIVIPLVNPAQVVEKGEKAIFDEPILLDLDGRAIRSIDYQDNPRQYWIAAGSVGTQADFAVFLYRPESQNIAICKVDFPADFTPEGVFCLPGRQMIYFISDDGTIPKKVQSPTDCMEGQLLPNGYCPNKFLIDLEKRTFRVFQFGYGGFTK
jgi:hypothetical protein